jgi:hypothetical protein
MPGRLRGQSRIYGWTGLYGRVAFSNCMRWFFFLLLLIFLFGWSSQKADDNLQFYVLRQDLNARFICF